MKNPAVDFAQITAKRTILLKLDYDNLMAYMEREPDAFDDNQKKALLAVHTAIMNNYFTLLKIKEKK